MAYQISSTNERSSLGIGESMNIFQMPSVDVGVSKVRYVDFQPINQLKRDSGMEFVITNLGNQYIDLRRTYLKIKARIIQGNGNPLPSPISVPTPTPTPTPSSEDSTTPTKPVLNTTPEGAKVGPVNNWMHSIFSQIDVYFQNKLVSSSNDCYPFEAMFGTLLNFGEGAKQTHLASQLFSKDFKPMDDANVFGPNHGLTERSLYTQESRVVDMTAPLMLDVFSINKYILNNVEIKVKLWPSNSAFHLMSDAASPDFRVDIIEAQLSVCIVTPTREMLISHQDVLEKEKFMATYQFMKTDIKKYSIAAGLLQFRVDNVYQGNIPTRFVIAMTSEEGVNGSYTRNPFNFKHYSVRYINVSVDNESIPSAPYHFKFGNDAYTSNCVDGYLSLYGRERLMEEKNSGLFISRKDYVNGYTMFVYDLEPDIKNEEDGNVWPTFKRGNLRVELNFDQKLPETVSVIMFATFPHMLKIDHARAVYVT